MDDPAETIAALDWTGRQRDHVGRLAGPALLDSLVRMGLVVVVDELQQRALQVSAAKITIRSNTSRLTVLTQRSE